MQKEQIYKAIALVVVAGFFLSIRVMKYNDRQERRNAVPVPTQDNRYAQLTIKCPTPRGQKEFEAIAPGMRFLQVMKAMHLKPLPQNLNDSAGNRERLPRVLVTFLNPDGTAIEAMFDMGRVSSRRRRGAGAPAMPDLQ